MERVTRSDADKIQYLRQLLRLFPSMKICATCVSNERKMRNTASNEIWIKIIIKNVNIRHVNILEFASLSTRPSVRQEVKQIKRNAESKANLIRTDINWTFAVDNDKSARNFPSSDIIIRLPASGVERDYAALSHRFQFAAIIYSPASLAGLSAYRKMLPAIRPETLKPGPDGFRETDVEIRESVGTHVCVKIEIYLRETSN